MPFRFYGSHVFLTYSQVGDRDPQALLSFLRQLPAPVDKFVIGTEQHQDGGRHFHVYLVFSTRHDTRSERFFDFDGVHPNIAPVRGKLNGSDAKRVYTYVIKDGNTIVWPEGADFSFPQRNASARYAAVVAAETREDARDLIRAELPRDYVLNLERVEYFLDRHFQRDIPVYASPHGADTWDISPVIEQWVRDNLGYVAVGGSATYLRY